MDIRELDREYVAHTYNRMDFVPESAEGCYLYQHGRPYLDMFSGLAVNVLGHRHPAVVQAIKKQCDRFLHVSNFFYNKPAVELAKIIVENSFPGRVFFANSGTESTEAALKAISVFGDLHDKAGIVVVKNSFHGRTTGALRLTRQPSIQRGFPMVDYPVLEVELNDTEELKAVLQEHNPAALLLEPILGSGGLYLATEDYLVSCQKLCREHGMLFCLDEIQTGMGRTGTLFAYQQHGLDPDLLVFAKGFGGGLPLGGMLLADRWSSLLKPGDHGSTFAPSPVSAAAGLATLQIVLKEGFLTEVREKSQWIQEYLTDMANRHWTICEIRGAGLMLGIVLDVEPTEALTLRDEFMRQGILVNITQQTVIRLLPPLIISKEELSRFLLTLEEVLCNAESRYENRRG